MINITDKTKCTGCGACFNICPVKCIQMVYDEEGFKYPKVAYDECINCGQCISVCPVINFKKNSQKSLLVCSATNKNLHILKSSSSGGVFNELAKYVLSNKGVVFGAVYDENIKIVHSYIQKEEEIYKVRGSKYAQSDTKEVYINAKKILKEGRTVLFSGTPCQIAGLNFFLKKEYDNLITCDFICTGVPSSKIFNAFKNYYEKKFLSKVTNVEFRNKKDGWVHFNMVFHFLNGKKKYISRYISPYILSFYNLQSLRPSCYECKFRKLNSKSDIKLADFWRINEIDKSGYDFYGVSHVLVNTSKGMKLFEKIKENLDIKLSSFEEVVNLNASFSPLNCKETCKESFFKNVEELTDSEIVENINKTYKTNLLNKSKIKIRVKLSKIKYTIKRIRK